MKMDTTVKTTGLLMHISNPTAMFEKARRVIPQSQFKRPLFVIQGTPKELMATLKRMSPEQFEVMKYAILQGQHTGVC